MSEATFIHLHVPKCGGSFFSRYLCKLYGDEAIHTIEPPYDEAASVLRHLPEARLRALRLVDGHAPFGLHKVLPNEARYLSLLRHPVDRMISHYFFVRSKPEHRLHREVIDGEVTLADYCTPERSAELENGMVRMLCGDTAVQWMHPDEPCPSAMLERAHENLRQHFAFVGLLERYDDNRAILRSRFGWQLDPAQKRKSPPTNRVGLEDLGKRERVAIEAANQLDLELYEAVAKAFTEQAATAAEHLLSLPDPRSLPRRLASKLKYKLNRHRNRPEVLASRAEDPYATHLPILIGLAHLLQPRRVLELGSGLHSTPLFLRRDVFAQLEQLDSFENDDSWLEQVRTATGDDPRVQFHYADAPMHRQVEGHPLDAYDLIFIDDSTTEVQRRRTIETVLAAQPRAVVVIHDFEMSGYREAAATARHNFRFTTWNPNTGVAWNHQTPAPRCLKALHRLIEQHRTIAPADIDRWQTLMEESNT